MEEEDRTPANEGGGVDYAKKNSSTALFGNQKPPRPLSDRNHRRAAEAAPEFAQEQEFHQQTALVVKEEVAWTWKRQQLQGCGASMSLSYRKTVLEDIRSVLTAVGGEKLLQQFSSGCFGHLMRFVGGCSCNKALLELISREISLAGAREDELWFHISGTNIRFAPAEYALVTGLHFGSFSLGSQEMLLEGGVCERFCGGNTITIKKLWERFNSRGVDGSAEDYLKVAHVLVLYLMGLGYYQRRTIDEWVWVLVEDLDSWNRFPWGAYTYQALIHCVSLLPKTWSGSGVKYYFYGPVWALQIWAYEAIPHFGNICALVIGQVTIPRCLRWLFPLRKIDLAHFFEQELVCSVTLEPTDEEQLQPYWLSVQIAKPLGVQYNPPQRYVATASRASPLLSFDNTSSISEPSQQPRRLTRRPRESTRPSLSSGVKKVCPQRLPEISDEARFVDRVSSRVVDRLTQGLIPNMKQWIVREVHDQLELMQGLLYSKSPGYNAESAKATEKKREEPSFYGGSSSMHVSRKTGNGLSVGKKKPTPKDALGDEERFEVLKNAPRSDTGVGRWEKQFVNRNHVPLTASGAQVDFNEPSRQELKQKPVMSPPLRGANITKEKKNTKKRSGRSPLWSEETSDDEGSKSSSGDERRTMKKKHKKNKAMYSESSLSESSSDRDMHRSRRKRHKRHCSGSSDSDDGGSRRHRHPRGQHHQHHSVSLPD